MTEQVTIGKSAVTTVPLGLGKWVVLIYFLI